MGEGVGGGALGVTLSGGWCHSLRERMRSAVWDRCREAIGELCEAQETAGSWGQRGRPCGTGGSPGGGCRLSEKREAWDRMQENSVCGVRRRQRLKGLV